MKTDLERFRELFDSVGIKYRDDGNNLVIEDLTVPEDSGEIEFYFDRSTGKYKTFGIYI